MPIGIKTPMINTLNESQLHKTLKTFYLTQNTEALAEQQIGKYIVDIYTKEGGVIEIQTASLSHLKSKIQYFIEHKKNITVVYPLVRQKYIETYSVNKELKSRRKSPSKKSIYSIFRELTSLTDFLENEYFYLHIVEVAITEERICTVSPVQSANKRRRFYKNWLKTGKRLEEIGKTTILHSKKDYLSLLPQNLSNEFTLKEVYNSFISENIKIKEQELRLMLWVYTHAGFISEAGKKSRSKIYKI